MRLAPEIFRAADVRWQLFVTLTWRGTPPRVEERDKALRHYLRMIARKARVPFEELLWLARDGDPEPWKRPHFHVLIAGIPCGRLGLDLGAYLAASWAFGHVEARLWDPRLGALGYTGRQGATGANGYESARFVACQPITSSEMLSRVVKAGQCDNVDEEDAEHSDNPVVGAVRRSVEAGSDQQQPWLTSLVAEVKCHLVAAKASRTHVELYPQAAITGAL